MIDLTDRDVFECMLSTKVAEGKYVDLHNEYNFISVDFNYPEKIARFIFRHIKHGNQVVLMFQETSIERLFLNMEDKEGADTLDLFYRGKFLLNGLLLEKSDERGSYFYLSFYNGSEYEIFSKKVLLILNKD